MSHGKVADQLPLHYFLFPVRVPEEEESYHPAGLVGAAAPCSCCQGGSKRQNGGQMSEACVRRRVRAKLRRGG